MTRQKYKKDFALATDKVGGGDVPNVTNIARGESDGEVIFTIQTSEIGDTVHVHALAQGKSARRFISSPRRPKR